MRTDHQAGRVSPGVVTGLAILVVVGVLALIWYAAEVLLLAFSGLLIALLLRGIVDWITARVPIPTSLALAGVGLGIAAALAGGSWLLADDVAAQFGQLVHDVPRALPPSRRVSASTNGGG